MGIAILIIFVLAIAGAIVWFFVKNKKQQEKPVSSQWMRTKRTDEMKRLTLALATAAVLAGCATTRYVPVIEHKTDTLIHRLTVKDSVWLHDSIYVREAQQGDTVRIVTDRWHTQYRDRWLHDTTYIAKRDSIPVPYEVVKEVPRKSTTIERLMVIAGVIGIMFALVRVVIKLKRFLPMGKD